MTNTSSRKLYVIHGGGDQFLGPVQITESEPALPGWTHRRNASTWTNKKKAAKVARGFPGSRVKEYGEAMAPFAGRNF